MANTNILIKRSTTTGVPISLDAGELAYSYLSNTIFIGSPTGNGVVNVGGQFYTSQIDNATPNATGLTLVRRDATGNASFNFITANIIGTIEGNAASATQLQTARNFSIDGGDITAASISFNGTGDVVLNASLDAVPSLGAGTYGSQTEIPVIQVAANGRVMNVTTSTISTTLSTAADSGTGSVNLLNQTLSITGGDGITSNVTGQDITVAVDNTVIRTYGAQQIIAGDLEISGNLIVTGNTTSIQVEALNVVDPIIYMAANNYVSDLVDIGWAGNYFDGVTSRHVGVIRKATTNDIYMFTGYDEEFDTNTLNIANPSLVYANVHANLISKYVQSPVGRIDNIFSSTGTVTISGNLDVTGDIVIDDLQVDTVTANTLTLTNALTVPNGGTGKTSFTSGEIIVGAGSGALVSLANSTYVATGIAGSNSTITSVTVDPYGRLTSATYSPISGLTVGQGGTGLSSITAFGVTYGNGTGNLGVTAAAGVADQTWSNQILTTTNAGVPVWTSALDGGTF